MQKPNLTQGDFEWTLNKRCTKFNSFYRFDADNRVPVVYMHLKSKGVPKKDALKFCARSLCRNDSTKQFDGPANYRVLKIKEEHHPTINVENLENNKKIKYWKGWQMTRPIYDLGSHFYQSHEDICPKDEEERLLEKHFVANEQKIKDDFKTKISNLAKYYKELNDQYAYAGLTKDELLKKVPLFF